MTICVLVLKSRWNISFLLSSRFFGWFLLWRGVIHGHLDQFVKGAVNGQLFVVFVSPLFLLCCHITNVRNEDEKNPWS